jgi:hypothetical protein
MAEGTRRVQMGDDALAGKQRDSQGNHVSREVDGTRDKALANYDHNSKDLSVTKDTIDYIKHTLRGWIVSFSKKISSTHRRTTRTPDEESRPCSSPYPYLSPRSKIQRYLRSRGWRVSTEHSYIYASALKLALNGQTDELCSFCTAVKGVSDTSNRIRLADLYSS